MKKIVSILFMLALSFSLLAQKSAVTSAWSYLKDGYLDDAKKSIDKAMENGKTKDWYKTHYFKGLVYQALGNSKEKKYNNLCGDDCFDIAYASFIQALKLNFVKPEHRAFDLETKLGCIEFQKVIAQNNETNYESSETLVDIILVRLPALANTFYNKGIETYNAENFEASYYNFNKALKISELTSGKDLELTYITSIAAMKIEKYDETISLSDNLISAKYGEDSDSVTVKINPYLNKSMALKIKGDTVRMLKTLEEGIAKYPQDSYSLVIEAFNIYVSTGQYEKAYDYINLVIEKNPKDAQFFIIRGTLSETMKKMDEAEADYKKALELENNNFEANYGLGAFYYNKAVDAIAWADENIPITDIQKSKEHAEEVLKVFKKALPYLEKSVELQPNNLEVLRTVRTIYYRLDDTDNYKKFDKKIKEITEGAKPKAE